jgi:dihydrofolate reductase
MFAASDRSSRCRPPGPSAAPLGPVGKRPPGRPGQRSTTHQPPKNPRDPAVTFLTGDIGDAIATARKAAGGKNVEIFGADLTGQCLERGLIDEIAVHIVPVLLGTGTPFSSSVHPARVDLEPLSGTHSGTVTTMRFRVRK